MTTSNNNKKTPAKTSSSTPSRNNSTTTPSSNNNNNYAAPHTPIASIKRPRSSLERPPSNRSILPKSSSSKREIMTNNSSSSSSIVKSPVPTSTPHTNHQSTTPSDAMSPLHPPKPLETIHDSSESTSWMTKAVTDALFSPMLHFLGGNNEEEGEQHGVEEAADEAAAIITDDDVCMADGTTASTNGTTATTTSNEQKQQLAIVDGQHEAKKPHTSNDDPLIEHNHSPTHSRSHSLDDDMVGLEALSNVATKASSEAEHDHHASPATSIHMKPSDDLSEFDYQGADFMSVGSSASTNSKDGDSLQEDDVSLEDDDEFNPYLFIKSLPPYHLVEQNRPSLALPPMMENKKYELSLVLDLDETLVHCQVDPPSSEADLVFPVEFHGTLYQVYVKLRPYLLEFLEKLSKLPYEVIVFTASQKVYAEELLNRIDPDGKYIHHRMFRESCLAVEGNFLKDLTVLGRDLRKTVLVDNSPHAFGYQMDNGIPIESWFEDPDDVELLKLEKFLRQLRNVEDVRQVVREKFKTYQRVEKA